MPETVVLTDRKNIWLSSVAGEVASIFADYSLGEETLSRDEAATLGEFKDYLLRAERGLNYKSSNGRNLSFERETLEDLEAMRAVALIGPTIEGIRGFLNGLRAVISGVARGEKVASKELRNYRKQLELLANLASREASNPEASHAL